MSVHLCVGKNPRFIARWRQPFARKFKCGPKRKKEAIAIQDMVREWSKAGYSGYIEADVIMVADYYEPYRVARLTR